MAAEKERLTFRPRDRSDNPRRTARLKAGLAYKTVNGKRLEQWQREISSAGRLWYCPDDDTQVVWITMVRLDHPEQTR